MPRRRKEWRPGETSAVVARREGQPLWKLIANLGDASPFEYGGYFVFVDETAVYQEEAELLIVENEEVEDEEDLTYTIYRIMLDRLKQVDGYLVPFKYDPSWPHPVGEYDEWFHRDLDEVASFISSTKEEMETWFTSADPLVRADAYRAIGDYHGWENLDSDPLTEVSRRQAERRYPRLEVL